MHRRKLWLLALVAGTLAGCDKGTGTPTTGVPVEPNKGKNAPGSYGDPTGGAKTAPPGKK